MSAILMSASRGKMVGGHPIYKFSLINIHLQLKASPLTPSQRHKGRKKMHKHTHARQSLSQISFFLILDLSKLFVKFH